MNARFEMLIEGLADPRLAERVAADRRPVGAPRAAVLLLLSDSEAPDLLFTERSARMRTHAGQISFPGGGFEPQDADAAAAALRETWEEVGLPPAQVAVIGQLPATRLPVSSYDVAPVVGTWSGDDPLVLASPLEVAAIHRWSVSDLADPVNRVTSRHPQGHLGPAWQFGDAFLWGFTAYLTDALLRLGGWWRPWDTNRVVEVPNRFQRDRQPR